MLECIRGQRGYEGIKKALEDATVDLMSMGVLGSAGGTKE